MADQNLIAYIKQNIREGFSEIEIRQALIGAGWGAVDVEEAFGATSPGTAKPRAASFDILEKELEGTPSKTVKVRKSRRGLIRLIILVLGVGIVAVVGYFAYLKIAAPKTTSEQVNSATTESEEYLAAASIRDRQRLENIEALQTALTAFYSAKKTYPMSLDELKAENILMNIPMDPDTEESYLYQALGEPPLDYSLTFILEKDFGSFAAGLHSVNPTNVISAAELKTRDQAVKGIIVKTPTSDLNITNLSDKSFASGDDVTVELEASSDLAQAVLTMDDLRLTDDHAPFGFTFSAPTAGTHTVKVFGFAKNGAIMFQSTTLNVNP